MNYPKDFWNKRYQESDYAYGIYPNEFLKQELPRLLPGKILFPADGEGRNGVFAATLGWEVYAFDISEAGQAKAFTLAKEMQVSIDYRVEGVAETTYPKKSFDALCLCYTHWPPEARKAWNQLLTGYLKPGGVLILEGFSKDQIRYQQEHGSGGPQNHQMLFSEDIIREDFSDFNILQLSTEEVVLKEGIYHLGPASVVRFVGRKK